MSLKEQTDSFLAQKRVAIVGVSRGESTGNSIFRKFRDAGYDVFPINPNAAELEGVKCYPNVKEIPGGVDSVLIVTSPDITEQVMQDCVEAGVSNVWMHYNKLFGGGNSSVSEEAVKLGRENGINVIPGACPMMYIEGADFGHKCMRWFLGVTGGLPESA
jgi:predicted CoA-binding protein